MSSNCKDLYRKHERYIQNTSSAVNSNRIIYSTNQESELYLTKTMVMQRVNYIKNKETLNHCILKCSKLDSIREPLLVEITSTCSQLFEKHKLDLKFKL